MAQMKLQWIERNRGIYTASGLGDWRYTIIRIREHKGSRPKWMAQVEHKFPRVHFSCTANANHARSLVVSYCQKHNNAIEKTMENIASSPLDCFGLMAKAALKRGKEKP